MVICKNVSIRLQILVGGGGVEVLKVLAVMVCMEFMVSLIFKDDDDEWKYYPFQLDY